MYHGANKIQPPSKPTLGRGVNRKFPINIQRSCENETRSRNTGGGGGGGGPRFVKIRNVVPDHVVKFVSDTALLARSPTSKSASLLREILGWTSYRSTTFVQLDRDPSNSRNRVTLLSDRFSGVLIARNFRKLFRQREAFFTDLDASLASNFPKAAQSFGRH